MTLEGEMGQRKHLVALIGFLDRDGLLDLRGLVDDRLAELEGQEQEIEDCSGEPAGQAGSKNGKGGYVELKYIRGFGPYAYRRWREGKRLRSQYLGKVESEAAQAS